MRKKTLKQLISYHDNNYGFCVDNILSMSKNKSLELDSLSIIIPYYETGEIFYLTLKHLYNSINYIKNNSSINWNFEIIVVDDGSKSKKAEKFIRKIFNNLKIIRLEKNQGRTVARNIGLQNAKYPKCLFMDSDVLVTKEFLFNNLYIHSFSSKKIISVGFFKFIKNNDSFLSKKIIKCSDIKPDDYRIKCIYGETWIGCEDDKKFINKKFEILKETNFFRNWPAGGFFGPWFLTNMVLGGFFIVDTVDAKKCNGFDPAFKGYGFTETSLPTKLIAGYGHCIVPILNGGCLHVDDDEVNVSRSDKDRIFQEKHNFYFNFYLNLTWKQANRGYGKK